MSNLEVEISVTIISYMKKDRTSPLCYWLKNEDVEDEQIDKVMHLLTKFCKNYVYDEELSLEDNRINSALCFDSFLRYEVVEINETDSWPYIRSRITKLCLVWAPVDRHAYDYLDVVKKLISIKDHELYICKPNLPEIEIRIIGLLKYMSKENRYAYTYDYDHVQLVKLKLDQWKERGYLDEDYKTKYEYKCKSLTLVDFFISVIDLLDSGLNIICTKGNRKSYDVYYDFMRRLFGPVPDTKKSSFKNAMRNR